MTDQKDFERFALGLDQLGVMRSKLFLTGR